MLFNALRKTRKPRNWCSAMLALALVGHWCIAAAGNAQDEH